MHKNQAEKKISKGGSDQPVDQTRKTPRYDHKKSERVQSETLRYENADEIYE
ncbi:hypothetical protein [Siminovitchia fortis]|uniref:hypothetical protein n=1 Tax=Siminovitchia fortis TaxID=254758 RepID=UPI0016424CB9|nr:hypothetical protein [Siminovitchia fortis]